MVTAGWAHRLGYLFTFALLIVSSSGCSGCRRDTKPETSKKDEKPPITRGPFRVEPANTGTTPNVYKSGHWGVASVTLTSNRDDLRGEIRSQPLGSDNQPASMYGSGTGVFTSRPAVLPKGQQKHFKTRFWLPNRTETNRSASLQTQLLIAGGEIEGGTSVNPIGELQSQEYALVVLSKRPDQWIGLNAQDWAELYMKDAFEENKLRWLRVMRPTAKDYEQLPESLLEWTTTSVMLWDDLHPDQLTESVQQGLIDWLHWGGTLIVNGPAAVDHLRKSQFEALLPLADAKLTEIPNESLAKMIENWTVPGDATGIEHARTIRGMGSIAGVDGTVVEGAEEVTNSERMVWRRRVGRGLVVMTRFNIDAPWLNAWRSDDAFFNGALLHFPQRDVKDDRTRLAKGAPGSERLPHHVTNLRLFSRDADGVNDIATEEDRISGWLPGDGNSLGEFSGHSAVVDGATASLRDAAGINIPNRDFVWRKLALYLALLIPVNFFVVWIFGRVELGWATIPFLALFGAIWITRSAQLDIGFARSVNEIDIIELQPGYSRGHLTRVMAIYNSLSTRYEMNSDGSEFLIGPVKPSSSEIKPQATEDIELKFGGANGAIARGMTVPSNRTMIFRGEQMVSLPGPIEIKGQDQVVNSTEWDLEDVSVWWNDNGKLMVAPVGGLSASSSNHLEFMDAKAFQGWSEVALGADKLASAVSKMGSLTPGAMRLIGRIGNALPGCEILPKTNQSQSQTIVVAHLRYGALPKCQRDLAIPAQRKDSDPKEDGGTFEIVN